MKKRFLKLMVPILFVVSSSAYAETGDIKVTADVSAGCKVNAKDIHFGDLNAFNASSYVLKDIDFSIQCSKGVTLTLNQKSTNNPNGYNAGFMTIGGAMVPQGNFRKSPSDGLQYFIKTHKVVSNELLTVTGFPGENILIDSLNYHNLIFVLKTSGETVLPLMVNIPAPGSTAGAVNDISQLPPGQYYDTMTYNLFF